MNKTTRTKVSKSSKVIPAGDKRGAVANAEQCGVYAGIAMALAEARAKSLRKGEAAAEYTEVA